MSPAALVRRPSPRLAEGLITHIQRQPIDVELAGRQWQSYVDTLAAAGWTPLEVPAAPDHPDSVFVEDTAVMFDSLAVITNPAADQRRGETEGTQSSLEGLGYRTVRLPGGLLDGGDILKVGRTVYVGRGGRTDAQAVASLRSVLTPEGWNVMAVPLTKVLHLKSAVTALPDGSVIGYPPLVDDPTFFPHFRAMPEEGGSHVVDLGEGRLLVAASAPRSADLLAQLGYQPVVVDIGEFEKLEGCVTCLSIRLRKGAAA